MIFRPDQLRDFIWGSGNREKWASVEGLASIVFVLYATLLIGIRLHRTAYIASSGAVVGLIIVVVIMLRFNGKGRFVKRVHAGEPCPCGLGTVRLTSGQFGEFLGCTNFRYDRSGCNRAWDLDGRRFKHRPW
jgi:hypothetical protein